MDTGSRAAWGWAAYDGVATVVWRRPERTPWLRGPERYSLVVRAAFVVWTGYLLLLTLVTAVPPLLGVGPVGLRGRDAAVALAVCGGAELAALLAIRWPVAGLRVLVPSGLVAILLPAPVTVLGASLWVFVVTACFLIVVVGLTHPPRIAVAAWALLAVIVLLRAGDDVLFSLLALSTTLLAAVSARSRREAAQRLLAERQRAGTALAEQAVLAERARIAREMHDVVAHHLSLIAVRCESAPYRLTGLPEPVSAEFGEVATASRQALGELQALLGVLRADGQPAEHAPQPGFPQLVPLLEDARASGAEVDWTVDVGEPAPSAAVGLTVYRIVQEALANAVRHAAGAPVHVRVGAAPGELTVEVVSGAGRDRGPGSGLGLVGMRERAALLGGSVHAGPEGPGWVVRARLPRRAADPSPGLLLGEETAS